jgi:hypothetical protein
MHMIWNMQCRVHLGRNCKGVWCVLIHDCGQIALDGLLHRIANVHGATEWKDTLAASKRGLPTKCHSQATPAVELSVSHLSSIEEELLRALDVHLHMKTPKVGQRGAKTRRK